MMGRAEGQDVVDHRRGYRASVEQRGYPPRSAERHYRGEGGRRERRRGQTTTAMRMGYDLIFQSTQSFLLLNVLNSDDDDPRKANGISLT
jgi:hypothetical protein